MKKMPPSTLIAVSLTAAMMTLGACAATPDAETVTAQNQATPDEVNRAEATEQQNQRRLRSDIIEARRRIQDQRTIIQKQRALRN